MSIAIGNCQEWGLGLLNELMMDTKSLLGPYVARACLIEKLFVAALVNTRLEVRGRLFESSIVDLNEV